MYDLWHVGNAVGAAKEHLDYADRLLGRLWADFPGEHDWPAMEEVHRKIAEALKAVEAIMTPEFESILAEEAADMDHLSDLADGASY